MKRFLAVGLAAWTLLTAAIYAIGQTITTMPPLGLPSASGNFTCTVAGVCTVSSIGSASVDLAGNNLLLTGSGGLIVNLGGATSATLPAGTNTLAALTLAQTWTAAQELLGTITNNNAAAGKIGEYVVAGTSETDLADTGATITVTIASPGVVTWGTTSPYVASPTSINSCAAINFTTSGALPTGIVAGTVYYVVGSSISGNTFRIATSCDNAIAGTAINTSGTQSGTHTGVPAGILATGAIRTVSGLALTAGDWDVSGTIGFDPAGATTVTYAYGYVGTSAAAASTAVGRRGQQAFATGTVPAAGLVVNFGLARFSLASTTTIYCAAASSFGVSTNSAWGGCNARRAR